MEQEGAEQAEPAARLADRAGLDRRATHVGLEDESAEPGAARQEDEQRDQPEQAHGFDPTTMGSCPPWTRYVTP